MGKEDKIFFDEMQLGEQDQLELYIERLRKNQLKNFEKQKISGLLDNEIEFGESRIFTIQRIKCEN